jgi:HEAT repeat protein
VIGVWLHVRVLRVFCSSLALAVLATSLAACENQPSALQANVRMAVGPRREATSPLTAPATAVQDERIDDLLAALIAGREGDGLPARLETVLGRDQDAVRAAAAFVHGGRATKVIIDALAGAGTPAAQDALCGLARDAHLPTHARAEAVASLGLIKHPTAPTMNEVAELIRARDQNLKAPALFLAGSVARAGRAEHPAQAAAIEHLVLAEAARARGTDDTLDTLAALGNLGSAAALPRLRAALAASDSRLRAAAARALRLVPDAEADRLLATTLRRDSDPTVRAAAVFAAGFRKLDLLADALAEAAQSDPVDFVRAGASTLLARPRSSSTRFAAGGAEPGR